ncbi:hypothetical protein JZO67_002747 [Enterococcus sp. 665A]|uniref:Uncharacterized protein n=1 Tax=Candidatus Enterococcus ferrettii TaxID=2815324 RepID=A0ABV0EQ74_9ENTE
MSRMGLIIEGRVKFGGLFIVAGIRTRVNCSQLSNYVIDKESKRYPDKAGTFISPERTKTTDSESSTTSKKVYKGKFEIEGVRNDESWLCTRISI